MNTHIDSQGNTDEQVHDIFFAWLDSQVEIPQLFIELPKLSYSDLVAFYDQRFDGTHYADLVFELWHKNIYNKANLE